MITMDMSPRTNVGAAFRALPLEWISQARYAANGQLLAAEVTKPLSHFMGADQVAIALAGARVADLGGCITANSVSAFAGQSRSTCAAKLKTMVRWFQVTSTPCQARGDKCPRGTRHYQFSVPN
jgi:hypothetical protein